MIRSDDMADTFCTDAKDFIYRRTALAHHMLLSGDIMGCE